MHHEQGHGLANQPKHGWSRAPGAGVKAQTPRAGPPTPGGTGFGYYFYDSVLLWANSTFIDYSIITPSRLGGSSTDWLYLTTTCRAQLGTEALVGYYQQDEARFMVFDWARAASDPWQVSINLPTDHPGYLEVRLDEFGNPRPICRVRNGTFLLGATEEAYLWRNEVLLFDFVRGGWDLVYSYNYATDSLGKNRFQSGANGYWGPIIETFGSYDRTRAIGFDQVRLFQDGGTNAFWLTPANSFLRRESPFQAITVASNRSFSVYAGTFSPDSFSFSIGDIARDPQTGSVLLQVDSLAAREFQVYSGIFAGGHWTWLPAGSPVPGTGQRILLQAAAPLRTGLYKVGAEYKTGSLSLVVNQPEAAFALTPDAGIAASHWFSQPLSNRWDKTIVALPPGKYTVRFNPISGLVTPPEQEVMITNREVTSAYFWYGAAPDQLVRGQ